MPHDGVSHVLRVRAFSWWPVAVICAVSLVHSSAATPCTVRVGIYQNEPKIFRDADGRPSGLFVELLEAIAAEEGWTLEFVPCQWHDCLAQLSSGGIDLMPDVAYSMERDERYDFHRTPVAESWSRVYAKPGAAIYTPADLSGRRVAVLKGVTRSYSTLSIGICARG